MDHRPVDRFVLDTSVFRRLPEREHDVVVKLTQLRETERVELIGTHVQRDELAATDDEAWRARLLAVYDTLTVEVPTGGLDTSNWGSRWMGSQQADAFDRDLRTALTHYRGSSRDPLCGDTSARPAFAHGNQAATCATCRDEREQDTHRFRNRNTGDALIIETAAVEQAQYVADDAGARKRAERHGLDPWDVERFFAWVLNQ
jgi:hypothetical protein